MTWGRVVVAGPLVATWCCHPPVQMTLSCLTDWRAHSQLRLPLDLADRYQSPGDEVCELPAATLLVAALSPTCRTNSIIGEGSAFVAPHVTERFAASRESHRASSQWVVAAHCSMEAAAAGQQTSPRSLLVEATEAHDALVGLLPAPALAALACTCRDLRHAAAHSPAAAARWRGLAEEALGRSVAAMHEALLRHAGKEGAAGAPPDGGVASAKANNPFAARAAFWRSLCRSAAICEELHWSDTGAARLWSCVDTPRRVMGSRAGGGVGARVAL